ncbi:large ribosomal subunit protein P2-like [Planococcus citri]|uniref:large ribosomal subunit protein P2-like n=1 Tax=Planococcus citri TaxID=170843 RepID=UPI0031F832B5
MRYVAAYMLSSLSGKEPSAADIEKILGSVGIESDADKVQSVIKELKGKNIEELVASGRGKLASMPVGGGVAVAAAGGASAATAAEPAAEKKEDKKAAKEESDESDDDMGFGLFD